MPPIFNAQKWVWFVADALAKISFRLLCGLPSTFLPEIDGPIALYLPTPGEELCNTACKS